LYAVALYMALLAKRLHKRIDAVINIIGEETIHEKFSHELKDMAAAPSTIIP
jgi:hypothetical protein